MLGGMLGAPPLKALAAATQIAPAMKVFTAHQSYETQAARFTMRWQDHAGATFSLQLRPISKLAKV